MPASTHSHEHDKVNDKADDKVSDKVNDKPDDITDDKVNGKSDQENGDNNEPVGSICECRIRQQRYNRDGEQETVVVENLDRPKGVDKSYALVAKQEFNDKHRLESETVNINSEYILKAFREVIGSYPTIPADFSEPFEMQSPFRMLYHYWDDLTVYRDSCKEDEPRTHLSLLLKFMDMAMDTERNRCVAQLKKLQVDYDHVWTIYRPGDIQIRFENGHPWLLKLVKTAYEENEQCGKYFEVHCSYTDFDGTDVGEADLVMNIRQRQFFASGNPANITDLPVYPRKFFKEGDSLEERLLDRGERCMALRETLVRTYDGLAAYMKRPPEDFFHVDMANWNTVWWPYKESGRVIIDRKTFQEDYELSGVSLKPSSKMLDQTLCPPFVYGYSLARKEWCRFFIDHLAEVEWNRSTFDSLVIKPSQKTLLKALVSSHQFPENPRNQMTQKGKGLVVLLHGTPGSGKTLTAEGCAEITKKALFSTSLAELNKENCAYWFEYRLVELLRYATMWKAVVLFDEADVFLESREGDGLNATERNALVAVFLKHLEYFSGIVFLTTNRIQVFDKAMKSRVHLALSYHEPQADVRRKIWTRAVEAIPVDERQLDVAEVVDEFIDFELNGREITNAINTARTLARFERVPLQDSHIQTVLGVRNDFDEDLKKLKANIAEKDLPEAGFRPIIRQNSLLGSMSDEPHETL